MKAGQHDGSEGSSAFGSTENGWPQDATAPRRMDASSLAKQEVL